MQTQNIERLRPSLPHSHTRHGVSVQTQRNNTTPPALHANHRVKPQPRISALPDFTPETSQLFLRSTSQKHLTEPLWEIVEQLSKCNMRQHHFKIHLLFWRVVSARLGDTHFDLHSVCLGGFRRAKDGH